MNDVLNIVIRLMPSGDELDVELPKFSTGREITEELLSQDVAPRADPEGNPYIYELISKYTVYVVCIILNAIGCT